MLEDIALIRSSKEAGKLSLRRLTTHVTKANFIQPTISSPVFAKFKHTLLLLRRNRNCSERVNLLLQQEKESDYLHPYCA